MLDKWHKKEKPVFTGIARGVGGFAFGSGGGGGGGGIPEIPVEATGTKIQATAPNWIHISYLCLNWFLQFVMSHAGDSLQRMEIMVIGGGAGASRH